MPVLNPHYTVPPTPAAGIIGGLTETQWQTLISAIVTALGGPGYPNWPAPGEPLSWLVAPQGGWPNGQAPVAGQYVTMHDLVGYIRANWPSTLPALGSTVTVPTSTGGTMTMQVTLDGNGVAQAMAAAGYTPEQIPE